ncbi:zinc-binding dehydrogenase [Rugosimonospora africana]|uniref:Zn-dependent oxidoreductase n=1 Tax=Rugosimonospora africana TaxID=556532 RepID=A0A8J3QKS2_9ACTN|nr:zinc-binding dehydrogenase [Rugosimonospora africana]GIH12783.1 Zn-dependent oxidoreductase [Rugosimonospora africana]
MLAAYASAIDPDNPLAGLTVGELEPATPEDWVTVEVRASSLNHHDLWSLRGVGLPADRLPMVLGCDAAGVDPDGNEVVVHAVIGSREYGDETMDPRRTLLSEKYPGTLAERVRVPRGNLVPKPAELSFAEAACLPTAWLTAYRMLRVRGRLPDGGSVLVQGGGGGVATAAIVLGTAMGARVYATSRDPEKRERIATLGGTAVEPGARLPERVDVVIETVGAPTIEHSLKCANQGGRIVVSGATAGHLANIDLRRVFFLQLEILGSTMGTRDELAALLALCAAEGVRPIIDSVYPFSDARRAFEHLESGEVFGKLVLDHKR